MSAADKRVAELLERWLASVQLHERYLDLDDQAYAEVQDWPRHQRPTRWVVELARSRLAELAGLLEERRASGDERFAEALELMAFLTTLLGSEHIERFIPLAVGKSGASQSTSTPRSPTKAASERTPTAGKTMPKKAAESPKPAGRPKTGNAPPQAAAVPDAAEAPPDRMAMTVIADAVRFLGWGREWPQLAGLIARLADRPSEQDIWKILKAHRAAIEAQARTPRD